MGGGERQRQASLRRRRRRNLRRGGKLATDLQELLASELGRAQFATHLEDELAHENLMFWHAIDQCPAVMQLDQAHDIVRRFVSPGGEHQVNISAAQRERIEAGVECASQKARKGAEEATPAAPESADGAARSAAPDKSQHAAVPTALFGEAQQEVFELMCGSFARFEHQHARDSAQTPAAVGQRYQFASSAAAGAGTSNATIFERLRKLSSALLAPLSTTVAKATRQRAQSLPSAATRTRVDATTPPTVSHQNSVVLESAARKLQTGIISQAEYHHILECERRFTDFTAAAVAADLSVSTGLIIGLSS